KIQDTGSPPPQPTSTLLPLVDVSACVPREPPFWSYGIPTRVCTLRRDQYKSISYNIYCMTDCLGNLSIPGLGNKSKACYKSKNYNQVSAHNCPSQEQADNLAQKSFMILIGS